jgi:hypothetical protein
MLSCAFPAKLSAGYLHGFVSVQHAVSHLPAKLSASYLHGFVPVQHAVSLLPGEAFRKLFPRFGVRPACSIASSQRSFPQAISTVLCPSSMLYRIFQRSFPQAISTVSCPSSMLYPESALLERINKVIDFHQSY